MTLTIYAWPRALKYTASLLEDEIPVQGSRGLWSGRDWVSSAGPRRRTVRVTVSSMAGLRDGAGISASLYRLLGARVNLVRMDAPTVNWVRDAPAGPYDLSGPAMAGTAGAAGGFPALSLSGLAPGAIVCRAYDVIGSYADGALVGTARAVRTVRAALDGSAVIALHDALPSGIVRVGAPESGVFRLVDLARSEQLIAADYPSTWSLREVLSGEIPEDAVEVDPWG